MLWILGGSGQVGRALTRAAIETGVAHKSFSHAQLDICDESAIHRAIGGYGIVINCAAYTGVDRAEMERKSAHAVNTAGAANVARAASAQNLPLVHLSTDYVFDGLKTGPYVEEDAANPVSVYGRSKAEGETAIRTLCPRHVIVRTSWVFGAEGRNFVRTMLRLRAEQRALRVIADQHGGPTSADDIAGAVLTIANRSRSDGFGGWGTYHFTGAPATTWYEFARAILGAEEGTTITPIASSEYGAPARRPPNSVLDCSKIYRVFGIGQPNWHQSLARVLSEIKEKSSN